MKKKPSGRTPRLGQHFLTGAWAARALARAAGVSPESTVVEIGPGTGALTRELLAAVASAGGGSSSGGRVIAIEKDNGLVERLNETFRAEIASKKLRVIRGDVRNVDLERLGLGNGEYVVAANIPYYITGEIVRMFLTTNAQPRTMALLVQKEVAQRIVSNKESLLSLSVKAYGVPRIIAKVSRGNFSPPPSVDSAILAITDISRRFFDNVDESWFFTVAKAGFSSKRKLLAGNLSVKLGRARSELLEAFAHCGIPERTRAEDVLIEKWKCLAWQLAGNDN